VCRRTAARTQHQSGVADRFVEVGEKGVLRFSSDGGQTSIAAAAGDAPAVFSLLRDLDFDAAGMFGYTVARGGMVLRSADAGQRWRPGLPTADPSRGLSPTAGSILKRATLVADDTGRRRVE
jgi:photosystem II stability/assembly factor-like uncharacterized protein